MIKDLEKELWELVEASKGNKPYCKPREQQDNLEELLMNYTQADILALNKMWHIIRFRIAEAYKDELYNKIFHFGCDGYDYCTSWMVGQGKKLYDTYMKCGCEAVINYVQKYKIPEEEYSYEDISYAFLYAAFDRK